MQPAPEPEEKATKSRQLSSIVKHPISDQRASPKEPMLEDVSWLPRHLIPGFWISEWLILHLGRICWVPGARFTKTVESRAGL